MVHAPRQGGPFHHYIGIGKQQVVAASPFGAELQCVVLSQPVFGQLLEVIDPKITVLSRHPVKDGCCGVNRAVVYHDKLQIIVFQGQYGLQGRLNGLSLVAGRDDY